MRGDLWQPAAVKADYVTGDYVCRAGQSRGWGSLPKNYGFVTGKRGGKFTVEWADGTTTSEAPDALLGGMQVWYETARDRPFPSPQLPNQTRDDRGGWDKNPVSFGSGKPGSTK